MVTRYEVLTGGAAAGVAVIRLVGPGAGAVLAACTGGPLRDAKHWHGRLLSAGCVVDDVVVVGVEVDVWEVCCHGGQAVVRGVCRLLEEHGAVAGDVAGEQERQLAKARTEVAVKAVLERGSSVNRWLLEPPLVVLVGEPNAGKSSLLNALAGEERAIVSPVAGTTRDAVETEVDCDGLIVRMVDAPGVRDGADEIERQAIRVAERIIAEADLLVVVRDGRDAEGPPERVRRWLEGRVWMEVRTRRDLVGIGEGIRISSVTGEGLEELRRRIFSTFVG
jgi:small GTP-binding protein